MKNKRNKIIVIIIAIVIVFSATYYAYFNYFGPKVVLQTNPDSINCKQGNVLEGEDTIQIHSIIYL